MASEPPFTIIDVDGALAMTGGDRGLLVRIAGLVVKQLTERGDKMALALAARDRPAIGREAHALKGSVLTVAATEVSQLCAEMEKCAKSAEWARVEAHFAQMQPAMARCADELTRVPAALNDQAA